MKEDTVRFAHTYYCDDARTEITGKNILIGVYNSILLVPSFPQKLHLVILSSLIAYEDVPLTGDTQYRVFKDAEQLLEITIPLPPGPPPSADTRLDAIERLPPGEERTRAVMQIQLGTSIDFEATEECVIRARFFTERGFVRAGALKIGKAPEQKKQLN